MPLYIIYDDITQLTVDGVVNAANENLTPGGGVCGAIFKAAGSILQKDCQQVGHCDTGSAIITFGYKLKASYVIHAVGPMWQGGSAGEEEKLYSCYKESMVLISTHDCDTAAFPLISSGIYGYPKNEAFHVAVKAIGEYLLTDREILVFLSNFGQENLGLSVSERQKINTYLETGYSIPLASDTDGKDRAAFKDFVLSRLKEEGLSEADGAKRANLLERDLTEILSYNGEETVPAKEKLLSLLVALKAEIAATAKYLSAFGYVFDPQSVKDKIVLYFLENGITDVFYLNEAVHAFTHQFLVDTDPALIESKKSKRKKKQ
jgi:O-acetyl-ADP-ribose deacetylase (regulator of RNase III)